MTPPGADRDRASILYLLHELGVEVFGGEVLRQYAHDGFEFRITLPFDTEEVKITAFDLRSPRGVVDSLVGHRDRLFARALGHMAKHDIEIGAILRRQQEIATKRAQLIAILEGMSATSTASEVKP